MHDNKLCNMIKYAINNLGQKIIITKNKKDHSDGSPLLDDQRPPEHHHIKSSKWHTKFECPWNRPALNLQCDMRCIVKGYCRKCHPWQTEQSNKISDWTSERYSNTPILLVPRVQQVLHSYFSLHWQENHSINWPQSWKTWKEWRNSI